MSDARLSRRQLLLGSVAGAGTLALSACGSAATGSSSGSGTAAANVPTASSTATIGARTTAGTISVPIATGSSGASTASPLRPAVTSTGSSALSSAAPAAASSVKAGTALRLAYFGGGNVGIDYFAENAKAFAAKNQTVKVDIEPTGGNYEQKVLAAAAGGTPPDVILQGGRDFGLFVTKGVLQDLSTLVARDHYDTSDFFTVSMELTTWKNKVYGLPDDFNVLGLYYNRDLLRKSGVADPPTDWTTAGWSWGDMLTTAQKLTAAAAGGSPQFGFGQPFGPTEVASVLWSYGGDILNKEQTSCVLNQPEAVSALQYIQDVAKAKVAPTPDDLKQQDANKRFFEGQVALRIAGAFFSNPASQNIKSFDWDVAVLPAGPKGRLSVTGGSQGASWSVTTGSKQPDGAWALTQWMASPESLTILSQHGWIGARKSVGFSSAYLDPKQLPGHRKVFVDATEHVGIIPLVANWSDINDVMTKHLDTLQAGTQSAQDAGSAMVQEITPLLQ